MYIEAATAVTLPLSRIVSGGQSGADRAALDWAIAHEVPHGGWCPRGRRAEDGWIDEHYHLRETPLTTYAQRTEWNVRDADGTVLITLGARLVGGTKRTLQLARRQKKPCLHLTRTVPLAQNAQALRVFIREHTIVTLNVAGSRESEEPGIGEFVWELLDAARLNERAYSSSSVSLTSGGGTERAL